MAAIKDYIQRATSQLRPHLRKWQKERAATQKPASLLQQLETRTMLSADAAITNLLEQSDIQAPEITATQTITWQHDVTAQRFTATIDDHVDDTQDTTFDYRYNDAGLITHVIKDRFSDGVVDELTVYNYAEDGTLSVSAYTTGLDLTLAVDKVTFDCDCSYFYATDGTLTLTSLEAQSAAAPTFIIHTSETPQSSSELYQSEDVATDESAAEAPIPSSLHQDQSPQTPPSLANEKFETDLSTVEVPEKAPEIPVLELAKLMTLASKPIFTSDTNPALLNPEPQAIAAKENATPFSPQTIPSESDSSAPQHTTTQHKVALELINPLTLILISTQSDLLLYAIMKSDHPAQLAAGMIRSTKELYLLAETAFRDTNRSKSRASQKINTQIFPQEKEPPENEHDGEKLREIQQDKSVPGWLRKSFKDGKYRTVITIQPIRVYRIFGGLADIHGGFCTTSPANHRIQAKIDLALLPEWGNSRQYEAEIHIPAGVTLQIGDVDRQILAKTGTVLDGSAEQVLLPGNWPADWIGDIRIINS